MNILAYHATRKVDQAVETEIRKMIEQGVRRITITQVSEAVDCSTRTVQRSIQRLESGGRLRVIFKHGYPNEYEPAG